MRKIYTLRAGFTLICFFGFMFSITQTINAEDVGTTIDKETTLTKRQITADSMKWEYEAKTAVFTGNVNMIAEEGNITASKMTIFFDENDEIEKMIAEGTANLTRDKQKGGGEIIEIYPSQNLLILKQGAWISSDKALFAGEEIRFDTQKEIINITKGVKGEIQTNSESKPINGGTPARRTSSLAGGEAQRNKDTKGEENN